MSSTHTILIKTRAGWGLPSLSPACIAVEAYLRLANIPFAVQECHSAAESPTAQVPALDTAEDLVAGEGGSTPADEWAAAKTLLDYLRQKVVNLDRGLTPGQRAEALAFTSLLEARLQPALLYMTWCEADAYASYTRPEYGASQPFPLNYLIPRSQRQAVVRQLQGASASQIYADATAALDALNSRLTPSRSEGMYFFGQRPSTIDVLLFAMLSFLRAAPTVHPELRRKMQAHRALGEYIAQLSSTHFSQAVPTADEAPGVQWSAWREGAGAAKDEGRFNKVQSEREREMQRKGRIWLACAAAAIAAYVIFSGQVLELGFIMPGEYDEVAEEEE